MDYNRNTLVLNLELNEWYITLEIKPYGLGSRILDVEAFWYTEIRIIVFDCMVYPDPKFLISKTLKIASFFFWG